MLTSLEPATIPSIEIIWIPVIVCFEYGTTGICMSITTALSIIDLFLIVASYHTLSTWYCNFSIDFKNSFLLC